jgi:hypothetical protein
MIAFGQIYSRFPDSIPVFVEIDRLLHPARKVTNQLYPFCFRGSKGEPLLPVVLPGL